MDLVIIGLIGTGVMLLLMFGGMPIAFSMAIPGFLGLIYIIGLSSALPQLHLTFYGIVSTYSYTVLPFFILMGYFAGASGISSELYGTAEKWLRRLPGGLALSTIAACAGFAAICGSSAATAATMGSVAMPQMTKHGYDPGLAGGTVAAGGTLGFLIPPSAAFVIYGIITEQSIGRLLIAGFVPGILLAIAFMLIIVVRVKINPSLAPLNVAPITWKMRLSSLKDIWGVILVFFLVMGGIYQGFFTPTEAGAVGAFTLFIIALAKRKLTGQILFTSLIETAGITCMIFVIIFGAFLYSDFLALSRIPMELMNLVGNLNVSRYVIFALIILIYLVLGCFIESIPMIILTLPVVLPVILMLNFDPVWFGVIAVLMVEAALITPPVGMNVYIISGVTKSTVPITVIFRGAMPFLIAIFAVIIVLTIFPQIALFLPNLMIKSH